MRKTEKALTEGVQRHFKQAFGHLATDPKALGPGLDRETPEPVRKRTRRAVSSVLGGVARTVKKASGGIFGRIKKLGKGLVGGVKKASSGVLGGLKKIGQDLLGGLGPIGKAISKIGGVLNKAIGKVIKTFDFLSPALLLIPGVGPGLYAAYNVMKTAYYAANGNLKQAFLSGLGALTGVGGIAGKAAGLAQRGMDMFEAAKSALKGDVRSIIGLVGAAAGGMGGKLGAKVGDAVRLAEAGMNVQRGIQRGDMAAVLGGLSAGAGAAGQARWLDPRSVERIQEMTSVAGRGARTIDLMMRGDTSAAIAALSRTIDGLSTELGAERTDAIQQALGVAVRGASAFQALRGDNPADALSTIARSFGRSDARLARAGAAFARMVDSGDGPAMLRQLELISSLGGTSLDQIFGGSVRDLRAAMESSSPLAMRVSNAFANGLTDDAFDIVERGVTAVAAGRTRQRAGMGLALSRLGYGLAEAIRAGDGIAAGRSLDMVFAMAGVDSPDRLPSALGLKHLSDLGRGDTLATRAIRSLTGSDAEGDIAGTLRELAPWMDRGVQIFDKVRDRRIEDAIDDIFSMIEDNGVGLPAGSA